MQLGPTRLAFFLLLGALAGCRGTAPPAPDRPWDRMPAEAPHTDHTALIRGPFADGPAVTRRCLECHQDSAHEVMATSHWTWLGDEVDLPGQDEPVRIGKKTRL